MSKRLTKPVLAVLERCFSAEIEGGDFPLAQWGRGKPPIAVRKAIEAGLVEPAEIYSDHDIYRVTVRGYCLTDAGRLAWCEACRDADAREEIV